MGTQRGQALDIAATIGWRVWQKHRTIQRPPTWEEKELPLPLEALEWLNMKNPALAHIGKQGRDSLIQR